MKEARRSGCSNLRGALGLGCAEPTAQEPLVGGRSGLAEDVVLGEIRRIHQGATGLENLLFFSGFLWASLLHLICFTHCSLKDISLSLFQR